MAVIAIAGGWLVVASMLFVWMGSLGASFPHAYTTWLLYARQPHVDGLTMAYLVISGGVPAIPICFIAFSIARLKIKKPDATHEVYGSSEFANKKDMQAGGIKSVRSPFA